MAILALSLCLPVMAQEQNGWQFDSLRPNSSVSKSDAQQVYEVLLKMLDRWNAHDIEGHLEVYWKSSELLVVVDAEQFSGWQQLHDSYLNGYPDRNAMGFIQPKRIQVKLLKPDLALALTWWSVSFPSSNNLGMSDFGNQLRFARAGKSFGTQHTDVARDLPGLLRATDQLLSAQPIFPAILEFGQERVRRRRRASEPSLVFNDHPQSPRK